jgi:mannonate dehydratase
MNRRDFFQQLSQGAALAGLACGGRAFGAEAPTPNTASTPKLSPLKITKVKAILTAPARIRLCVVKVETSEPGLYGLGCATFTQRIRTVVTAVNEYLAPFLAGKDPDNIEDLWQSMYQSSYWRNGPVLMNALSGVDAALWDIKGKRVGMPLYQLLGGKCRIAVPVYRHASGKTMEDVAERAKQFMTEGVRYIRAQVGVEGQATYGTRAGSGSVTNEVEPKLTGEGHFRGELFEPAKYRRSVPKLFKYLREQLGDEIELLHDMHERLAPIDAIGLAKELEPYRLFFLEDPFAPEDVGYFKILRQQCATPIAMGELFNNPNEWLDLVSGRLIDFIRCHLSQVGGISAARKIATLCDFFRVRTAWHGPGDTSPVGHAAHVHLDLATWNFGIQEASVFSDALREVFPGAPELRDGMLWCNEKPGLGIDINETLAAKYPIRDDPPADLHWGRLRDHDGTIRRP